MRKEVEELLLAEKINFEKILEIIPELKIEIGCSQNHPAHYLDVWEHTKKVVEGLPKDLLLRVTGLLHDIGKPDTKITDVLGGDHFFGHQEVSVEKAKEILFRLDFDAELTIRVIRLIKLHDDRIEPNSEAVDPYISLLGKEDMKRLLQHQKADLLAHSQSYIERKMLGLESFSKFVEDNYFKS